MIAKSVRQSQWKFSLTINWFYLRCDFFLVFTYFHVSSSLNHKIKYLTKTLTENTFIYYFELNQKFVEWRTEKNEKKRMA